MKAILLSLCLLAASAAFGQPTTEEHVYYRLVDGFPPYQMDAQPRGKDGKYMQTLSIGKSGKDMYQIAWHYEFDIRMEWIKHVRDGLFGSCDPIENTVLYFETSYYYFDEHGCLHDVTIDPMGRGINFRYCPEP